MDPVLASWIKELVLRLNIPQKITDGFMAMLPSEPADSESESSRRVRRAIFQRHLAEAVARRVITRYTLGTIEKLYALHPIPAAEDAYRAIALHFLASALDSVDFSTALSDLRSRHIPNLRRCPPAAGLASPRLESEARDFERAPTDYRLRLRLMDRYSKSKALDALRAYVEAEYKDAGPPILEVVAGIVHGREAGNAPGGSRAEGAAPEVAPQQAPVAAQHQALQTTPPVAAYRQEPPTTPPVAAQHQALQTTPPVAAHQQASQTTPPVAAHRQALQTTPPAAAHQQALQTPSGVGQKAAQRPPQGGGTDALPPGEKELTGRSKIDGIRLDKGTILSRNDTEENSKKVMEQDLTVPSYERVGGLKGKAVCPPAIVENKRRKTRRWSMLEEDTLRNVVRELGTGRWKEILGNHSEVFVGRTEVDLKDKWRNMIR